MKTTSLIIMAAFFLLCCKKTEVTTPNIPMVKTEELKSYTHGNLTDNSKLTYTYDTQQRVVSKITQNMLNGVTTTSTYDYSTPNEVKELQSGGVNKTYYLDVNGRATQLKLGTFVSANYTYDANGYLLTVGDAQNSSTYTYTNANPTEKKTLLIAQNQVTGIEQYSYNSLPNTVSSQNKGLNIFGKASANFFASRSVVLGPILFVDTYSSGYDSNNLLTTYSWSRIGGNSGLSFVANYTYYP